MGPQGVPCKIPQGSSVVPLPPLGAHGISCASLGSFGSPCVPLGCPLDPWVLESPWGSVGVPLNTLGPWGARGPHLGLQMFVDGIRQKSWMSGNRRSNKT